MKNYLCCLSVGKLAGGDHGYLLGRYAASHVWDTRPAGRPEAPRFMIKIDLNGDLLLHNAINIHLL